MKFTAADYTHMSRALQLAERGRYTARPNPMVGCVLVKNDNVVGEGWHRQFGGAHAEVNALEQAGAQAQGSTAYITLEPCSHTGKTPPCSNALIAAGVKRVIGAMMDPNPAVSGRGFEKLRRSKIAVQSGLMEAQAQELNCGFVSRMRHSKPRVRCKLAMSLDGRTAMASGESKWVTGSAARADVQRLRARHDAVITGSGTVIADDPQLTVRTGQVRHWGTHVRAADFRQPLRVVLDRRGQVAPTSRIFSDSGALWITSKQPAAMPPQVEHVLLDADNPDFLPKLLSLLSARQCNDVLVECGAQLAGQFLALGLLDEILVYVAPKIMGDSAKGLFHLPQLQSLTDSIELEITDVRQCGRDLRLTLEVAR